MAKKTSELFSNLQSALNKLADKDGTPRELAAALNSWAHESADTLKLRVAEEVDSAVTKLGFIKREEFDRLVAEVEELKKDRKAPAKKKVAKKAPLKKVSSGKGKSVKAKSEPRVKR